MLRQEDRGTKIAYLKKDDTINVLKIDDLENPEKAAPYSFPSASIDNILWCSDGQSIVYTNNVGHLFDTQHQIVKYDTTTNVSTVLFDLKEYEKIGLPDDDVSDLMLSGERIFFKLGDGSWYSFREDDPVLKKEDGPAGTAQKTCPHSRYIVKAHTPKNSSTQIRIEMDSNGYDITAGTKPVWSPK